VTRFPGSVLLSCFLLTAASRADSPPDFVRDIQPIFQKRCYVCTDRRRR